MNDRSIKYWSAILNNYILSGREVPPSLRLAIFNRLRIELQTDPLGMSSYFPHRSLDDLSHLSSFFSSFPTFYNELLTLTEPIPIITPYAPSPSPAKSRHRTPRHATPDLAASITPLHPTHDPLSSNLENRQTEHQSSPSSIPFHLPDYSDSIKKIIDLGKPLLLVGPNGCGKTRLIFELARLAHRTVRRVNMDGAMTPDSFIGATKVRPVSTPTGSLTSETFFQLGPVSLAILNGDILILDEIDRAQPEYLTALQSLLEDPSAPFILNDDGGRSLTPHPSFRIVATANTLGQPDDLASGYMPGANLMNASFIDRFSILRITFPPNESDILTHILHDRTLSKNMVHIATLCRQSTANGDISSFDFSTRRLISWATTFQILQNFHDACDLELLSRHQPPTRSLIESFLSNVFGSSWRSLPFPQSADS